MSPTAQLVAALSCPARVSIAGMNGTGAVQTEAKEIEIIGSDIPIGIVIDHKRGGKSFVAWDRIVMIECLPKEEA